MNVITAVLSQEEILILVEVQVVSSPTEEVIGLATTGPMIFPIRDVVSKPFDYEKSLIIFYFVDLLV